MSVAKRKSAANDQDALDALYREHGDWLRSVVGKRFRVQPADAEDLVQEAYLRVARQAEPVDQPRAFLARIALNLFRDSSRRKAVRSAYAATERFAPPPTFTPLTPLTLCEQEATAELERLILDLPEPLRDVFVLSRFRHMTNRAIADHLGVSIKTVEWRMSKALDFCTGRLRD